LDGVKQWVSLVDEDPFYNGFGNTPLERQRNYQRFILEMDDGKAKEYLGLNEKKLLIGSERFKEKIRSVLKEKGVEINLRPRGRPKEGR
jgi:hypothetical protein